MDQATDESSGPNQLRDLTAARQEVNNLDSSVEVQELELAMNLAL